MDGRLGLAKGTGDRAAGTSLQKHAMSLAAPRQTRD